MAWSSRQLREIKQRESKTSIPETEYCRWIWHKEGATKVEPSHITYENMLGAGLMKKKVEDDMKDIGVIR